MLASVIANVNRGRGRPYKVEDFKLRFDGTPQRQTPEEMRKVFKAFADEQNRAVKRKAK